MSPSSLYHFKAIYITAAIPIIVRIAVKILTALLGDLKPSQMQTTISTTTIKTHIKIAIKIYKQHLPPFFNVLTFCFWNFLLNSFSCFELFLFVGLEFYIRFPRKLLLRLQKLLKLTTLGLLYYHHLSVLILPLIVYHNTLFFAKSIHKWRYHVDHTAHFF